MNYRIGYSPWNDKKLKQRMRYRLDYRFRVLKLGASVVWKQDFLWGAAWEIRHRSKVRLRVEKKIKSENKFLDRLAPFASTELAHTYPIIDFLNPNYRIGVGSGIDIGKGKDIDLQYLSQKESDNEIGPYNIHIFRVSFSLDLDELINY